MSYAWGSFYLSCDYIFIPAQIYSGVCPLTPALHFISNFLWLYPAAVFSYSFCVTVGYCSAVSLSVQVQFRSLTPDLLQHLPPETYDMTGPTLFQP